jgi:hypothetical protein
MFGVKKEVPLTYAMKYVGGFAEWNSNFDFAVKVNPDKTFKFYTIGKTYLESNISDIDIILEDEKQLSERVTATRLLLIGIFAFAFKKKQNINNKYITFKIKEIDLQDVRRKYENVDIILTSKNSKHVEELYNYIMKLKAQY